MSGFETVKQRADIVDVIGQYVSLQRAGRNFKAPCPFHQERTPSFYVFPDRQSWRCFGACATGGDIFTFIEKKEGLEPVDALKLLAERYGVELPQRAKRADELPSSRLIEANEAAALYYQAMLTGAASGEPARAYLERRGVDTGTQQSFRLGFAPAAWSSLRDHLLGKGFTPPELVEAGLLIEGERETHDRFRNRLMFPIADDRGRVIGFGGRVFDDTPPKYLNTPQTPIFDKSGTLYALDRAKDAIRMSGIAVVVEGYMDAIAAHQHGINNAVATLGTALTERHVGLLKRFARQVVLSMDADAAGIEAAVRGEEVVRRAATDGEGRSEVVVDFRNLVRVQAAAPVEVRVFTVPHGKDPDEAIRADPDAFRELTRQAVPPFEFRLRFELSRIDRQNPRERLELADRMLPLVAAVADRAMQAQYLGRLAQATAIPEEVLAGRLSSDEAPPAGRKRRAAPPKPLQMRESARQSGQAAGARGRPAAPGARLETVLLRLLMSYPGLREAGIAVDETLLYDPANRALLYAWRTAAKDGLNAALDDNGRAQYQHVMAERLPPLDDASAGRELGFVLRRLELRRLEDQARLHAAVLLESATGEVRAEAAAARALDAFAAEPSGETEELAARLLQGVQLGRELHTLESQLRTHERTPGDARP